jgi:hypothetical protein
MTIFLSDTQKKNLVKKAKSGDYYLRLSNYDTKNGQHIIIFPTDKGIKKGMTFFKNVYPVRPPQIPRPDKKVDKFNKRGGAAYKQGRFFVMSDTMAKVLRYHSKV